MVAFTEGVPIHPEPHPSAGSVVMGHGKEFRIEDWADRLFHASWREKADQGNPGCILYMTRIMGTDLPLDDEVVYGKFQSLRRLWGLAPCSPR